MLEAYFVDIIINKLYVFNICKLKDSKFEVPSSSLIFEPITSLEVQDPWPAEHLACRVAIVQAGE